MSIFAGVIHLKFLYMKRRNLFIVIMVLCCISCGESVEQKAQNLVDEARVAYEACDYQTAKILLDSVKKAYPKAFDVRRKALALGRDVELGEQRRSLEYFDSELAALSLRRDSLLPGFILEKDIKYQDVGNYMIPSQTVKNNLNNSYLRAQVDENGILTLTSVYRGKAISHNSVKVSSGNNYAECNLPFNMYSSKHLGVTTERLDFRYGQDGGLMDFISVCDGKILVELSGAKSYKYFLRKSDAKAIAQVAELAKILQAIDSLRSMRAETERHIEFIEQSKVRFDAEENNLEK